MSVSESLKISPTKGTVPSDALVKEIQDYVKKATAPYKYPRVVEFRESLPKTVGSGKIRRAEIRAQDMEKYKQKPYQKNQLQCNDSVALL